MIKHLKESEGFNGAEYSLSDIKKLANVEFVELVSERCWAAVANLTPNNEGWLTIGVFQFASQTLGDDEIFVDPIFVGEGPSDGLRELRHTWWGENQDGYIFYPNGEYITKALEFLKKYYDLD